VDKQREHKYGQGQISCGKMELLDMFNEVLNSSCGNFTKKGKKFDCEGRK
jgi:hypothetical protein